MSIIRALYSSLHTHTYTHTHTHLLQRIRQLKHWESELESINGPSDFILFLR